MNNINPGVDFYFAKTKKWQHEIKILRTIILSCGLTEELKWGVPCYTFNKNNIVLIHVFKEYCALLFFKGALLSDTDGILIRQTANVQSARQVRFTNVAEIAGMESILKAYIYKAIAIETAGLKVQLMKPAELQLPIEFLNRLNSYPQLKIAFEALTPGRQKGYSLYFAAPKQAKTREARIEKCLQQILNGKGLND